MDGSIVGVECDHSVLLPADADRDDLAGSESSGELADGLVPGELERVPPGLRILLAARRGDRGMTGGTRRGDLARVEIADLDLGRLGG